MSRFSAWARAAYASIEDRMDWGYSAFFSKLEFMIEVKVRDSTSDRRLTRIICLCCMDVAYLYVYQGLHVFKRIFLSTVRISVSDISNDQVHMFLYFHFLLFRFFFEFAIVAFSRDR